MNLISFIFVLLLPLHSFAMSLDDEKKYDELEGLSFIKALSKDQKYQEVVNQFPHLSLDRSEKGEAYFHLGEAYYQLKNFTAAFKSLQKAEKLGTKVNIYSLWGRVSYQLKNFSQCRSFYQKVALKDFVDNDWPLYFSCLQKSGHSDEAIELSLSTHSEELNFFISSQKVLLRFELFHEAQERRHVLFNKCRDEDFYLRLWDEIEKLKVPDHNVLETGHACHPRSKDLTLQLIKALFKLERYHSIAHLFEMMSAEDKAYFKHAAEFFKMAGRSTVSDYFFFMGSQQDFFLAKSSHFLNQENYAGLLTIPFRPSNLKNHQDLTYALAYSYFKYSSPNETRRILGQMPQKNGRFKQLDSLAQECQKMDWRCRP